MIDDDVEDDKKDTKASRKAQKEADLDEDLLPDSGLYTPEGHLFYHTMPTQMTKAQYKRAEENGINLRSAKNFTLEESLQIFKNWREFAENSNIQVTKALEYIQAKKKDGHIIQHQNEHEFWVKLCNGLPHRSCQRIKARAVNMMTDDFLASLDDDWSPAKLVEKMRERFYTYETYDEAALQKMARLLERGYASSHIAEILDVPVMKAAAMSAKLRIGERRDDQEMMRKFYESAIYHGLNAEKIREHVLDDNEIQLDRLRQNVNIEELSFRMHLTPLRCHELLKLILKRILKNFRDFKARDKDAELAWADAIGEFSAKLPIREDQILKALEIFCKNVTKEDTMLTLKQNETLAKILKLHGITGFQCETSSEFLYVHNRVFYDWLVPLEREFFRNLRRGFRVQFKLHCLLWAWKRMVIWEKLRVEEGKTRYEAVLESESANPLASKMTLKFLKNEKVCEWIMDPRPPKHRRNAATLRMEACIEAFILYTFRKFGGKFKFPKKLCPLVGDTSSSTIQNLLELVSDAENSEYLTMREVKEAVEAASGREIQVRIRNKAITMRKNVEEDGEEDSDSSEDVVEHLLNHARQVEMKKIEERKREMENVFDKMDTSKIRRKFRNREADVDEMWLSDELLKQKATLKRVAEKLEETKKKSKGVKTIFQSKAFIATSDEDSSSDDEKRKGAESEQEEEERNPYTFVTDSSDQEDSEGLENNKSPRREPEDSPDPEDIESPRREAEDPEDVVAQEISAFDAKNGSESDEEEERNPYTIVTDSSVPEDSEGPEDVESRRRDSEKSLHPEDVVAQEDFEFKTPKDLTYSDAESNKQKKEKKKRKKGGASESGANLDPDSESSAEKKRCRDSNDVGDSGDVFVAPKVPEDFLEDVALDSEFVTKRKKKRERRDLEKAGNSDNVFVAPEDASEDVTDSESKSERRKKKKKRKHRESEVLDSGVVDDSEVVVDSEDLEMPKKKKRKHRKSEDLSPDDVGGSEGVSVNPEVPPEDVTDSESKSEIRKKKKKRKRQDSEVLDSEDVVDPGDVEKPKKKKRKHRDSKGLTPDDVEDSEDGKKPKKYKNSHE